MTTVQLPGIRHVTSDDVWAELGERQEHPTLAPIPDAVAATIASWWQSSAGTGRTFAALASGAPVDADALYDDVQTTLTAFDQAHPRITAAHLAAERGALEELARWAEEHTEDPMDALTPGDGPDPWIDPAGAAAHQPPPF